MGQPLMDRSSFGSRLYELRVSAGLSASELSSSLGQNPHYIYDLEHGHAYPSLPVFLELCEALSIEPADFFDPDMEEPVLYRRILSCARNLSSRHIKALTEYIKNKSSLHE